MFIDFFMNLLALVGSIILMGLIIVIVALVAAVTYIIVRSIATSCKKTGKGDDRHGT